MLTPGRETRTWTWTLTHTRVSVNEASPCPTLEHLRLVIMMIMTLVVIDRELVTMSWCWLVIHSVLVSLLSWQFFCVENIPLSTATLTLLQAVWWGTAIQAQDSDLSSTQSSNQCMTLWIVCGYSMEMETC